MNSYYWGPICSSHFPFNLSDSSLSYLLWCWKVFLQYYQHNIFARFPLINFLWIFQQEKKNITHFCMKNELHFLHFLTNLHSELICATYSLWIMSKASSLSCHCRSEMFTVRALEILAAQILRIFLIHDNKHCPKFLPDVNRKGVTWRILELCLPLVMLF